MITNYNNIAKDYQKASCHPIKKYIESFSFLKQLGDLCGKSVLDLACGEGYYTRLIKQQGAAQVVGVDISEAMINQAKATESETPLGIDYYVKDVIELGQIGEFDVVTAVYLFPYAAKEQALAAMFKTAFDNLKPNGKLVAITLNPDLRAEDASIYPQYGIKIHTGATLQNGDTIAFTVDIPDSPNNSFDLLVTFWQQQTMENIAYRTGFQKIIWQSQLISREGLEKYPQNHWQAFLERPYSIVLVCHK